MHWDLQLKPHEYWEMDVEDWHTARAVQAAYYEGRDAVARDEEEAQRRAAREKEALAYLQAQVGEG